YTFTSPNDGINCSDGTTLGLSRTTPNSSTAWQYSRSTASPPSTTITDPLGNSTAIHFQRIYETERVVKNSMQQTLVTVDTCYNGAMPPCTTKSVTPPISNRRVNTTLPGLTSSQ